jgi:hypothetical protein
MTRAAGVEPLVRLAVRLRALGAEVPVCAPPDCAERPAEVDVPLVPTGRPLPQRVEFDVGQPDLLRDQRGRGDRPRSRASRVWRLRHLGQGREAHARQMCGRRRQEWPRRDVLSRVPAPRSCRCRRVRVSRVTIASLADHMVISRVLSLLTVWSLTIKESQELFG